MRCALVPLTTGNVGSIVASLRRLGHSVSIWETSADLSVTDWVIFPGVGAMQNVRRDLIQRQLLQPLEELRRDQQPTLGICLGLQLWFDQGEEGGTGFGWIAGTVPRLAAPVMPHIGWNQIDPSPDAPRWLRDYAGQCFYFVHSYYVHPDDSCVVAATAVYGQRFPSVVKRGTLIGMQFHPELSGRVGESLLQDALQKGIS